MKRKNNKDESLKESWKIVSWISILSVFMVIFLLLLVLLLDSCTVNLQTVHTTGDAKDVIDDNLTNQPDLNIKIPAL